MYVHHVSNYSFRKIKHSIHCLVSKTQITFSKTHVQHIKLKNICYHYFFIILMCSEGHILLKKHSDMFCFLSILSLFPFNSFPHTYCKFYKLREIVLPKTNVKITYREHSCAFSIEYTVITCNRLFRGVGIL